jgi:AcrR family transcriptional regulator
MSPISAVKGRPRAPRRDGEVTRERLISAAIDILSTEGSASLSTVRLAQAAGIVQSGFYVHFKNVGECEYVAAGRIGERIRRIIADWMAELREHAPIGIEPLLLHYDRVLRLLLSEWQFIALFIRYRRDPSLLGRAMAELHRSVHGDIVEHLLVLGRPYGLTNSHEPILAAHAQLILSAVLAATESIADGLVERRELVVQVLAEQTFLPLASFFNAVSQAARPPE